MTYSCLLKTPKAALIAAATLLFATFSASAVGDPFGLGFAKTDGTNTWAIFTLGNAATDIDLFSGNATVFGDIGGAGDGKLTMSGNVKVYGEVVYKTGGTLKRSGSVFIEDGSSHN